MAYEKREGSGSLFKNDRKEKDSHPDYKGDLLINGQEYWISAWLKTAGDGKKFMSLSVQPKQARQEQSQPARNEYADATGRAQPQGNRPSAQGQKKDLPFNDDTDIPF